METVALGRYVADTTGRAAWSGLIAAAAFLPTAFVGIFFGGAASTGVAWLPPLLAVPVLAVCLLSLRQSLDRYGDPQVRARIVATVSAG